MMEEAANLGRFDESVAGLPRLGYVPRTTAPATPREVTDLFLFASGDRCRAYHPHIHGRPNHVVLLLLHGKKRAVVWPRDQAPSLYPFMGDDVKANDIGEKAPIYMVWLLHACRLFPFPCVLQKSVSLCISLVPISFTNLCMQGYSDGSVYSMQGYKVIYRFQILLLNGSTGTATSWRTGSRWTWTGSRI